MKQTLAVAMIISGSVVISPAMGQTHMPYAGLQSRPIKALSPEQVDDLRSGRGMGLALAAELNGYPGPIHVLELADKLELTADQRLRVAALFEAMKAEAIPLGERLIAQESELDHAFVSRSITVASLERFTGSIAETQASLRNAHLKYHLSTVALLEPGQITRYAGLRGYSTGGPNSEPGQHHRRAH